MREACRQQQQDDEEGTCEEASCEEDMASIVPSVDTLLQEA